jgi:hypothetical protein
MVKLFYPELQFSCPSLDRLSELERQGPISKLGLSVRAQNILQWRKVNTIGELVEVFRSEVGIVIKRNFGPKTHANLVHSILALSQAATPEGGVDWQKYDELAKKKFCGMRAREAVRYVGLMQTVKLGTKRNDWPRPFGKIPDSVSNQLLETLSFGNRAFYVLKSMGAVTIGDATRICPTDLLEVRNVGRKTIKEIFQTIMAAVDPLGEDPISQDNAASAIPRIPMVPERFEGLPEEFYLDFFNELPLVIKKYEGNEEETILRLRLFCPLGKAKTLQVIGKRIGVTRERVRQKEADLILKLKSALFEARYTYTKIGKKSELAYGKVRFRVRPELQELCKKLPERLRSELPPVVRLSQWTARLANILHVPTKLIEQYLTFWLTALRFKENSVNKVKGFKNEDLIFRAEIPTKEVEVICGRLVALNDAILSSPSGATYHDILSRIKLKISAKKFIKDKISFFLKLSSVTINKKKTTIQPIYNQDIKLSRLVLERELINLLLENGCHFKKRTLLYRMQEKYPTITNINKAAIDDIIAKSERIFSIGKTGYCKLKNTSA